MKVKSILFFWNLNFHVAKYIPNIKTIPTMFYMVL